MVSLVPSVGAAEVAVVQLQAADVHQTTSKYGVASSCLFMQVQTMHCDKALMAFNETIRAPNIAKGAISQSKYALNSDKLPGPLISRIV